MPKASALSVGPLTESFITFFPSVEATRPMRCSCSFMGVFKDADESANYLLPDFYEYL